MSNFRFSLLKIGIAICVLAIGLTVLLVGGSLLAVKRGADPMIGLFVGGALFVVLIPLFLFGLFVIGIHFLKQSLLWQNKSKTIVVWIVIISSLSVLALQYAPTSFITRLHIVSKSQMTCNLFLLSFRKEECEIQLSIVSQDPKYCVKYSNNATCFPRLALVSGDEHYCGSEHDLLRADCYKSVAIAKKDSEICSWVAVETNKYNTRCAEDYDTVLEQQKCMDYYVQLSEERKNECKQLISEISSHNLSACLTGNLPDACYFPAAISLQDKKYCNHLRAEDRVLCKYAIDRN